MRVLIVMERARIPMEDCALAGPMIALYGRPPRANRRRRIPAEIAGAMGLVVLAWAMVVLAFVW